MDDEERHVIDRMPWYRAVRREMAVALAIALLVAGCAGSDPSRGVNQASPTSTASSSVSPTPSGSLPTDASPPAPDPSLAAVEIAPGLVDIGDRSLFMECRGSGSPTVIFLAGTQVPRLAMREVEDGILGSDVRVCDYDRAGEGRSGPATTRQTDLDVVDDLAALLAAAEIPPPYVLVGHSVGGDQAWLYADRHPAGLAGFLIMNAGFFELDWNELHDVWSDTEIAEERAISEAGLGSVKQAASPPEGVPYVVMMSTIAQCANPTDICGRIYPFFEAWAKEIAARTPDGRLVFVEAGHEIYLSKPGLVVEEIKRLIPATR